MGTGGVRAETSSDVVIRAGHEDDMAQCYSLLVASCQERSLVPPMADRLCADFRAGAFCCMVAATALGSLVGVALFYPLWDVCRCVRFCYLEEVFVEQGWRRRGVGRRLVGAVLELAGKASGVAVDFRIPATLHEPALSFSKALGALFCSDFVSVSLSGEALRRAAGMAPDSDSGSLDSHAAADRGLHRVAVRAATPSDSRAVGVLIRELAEEEGQGQNWVDGCLPIGARRCDDQGEWSALAHPEISFLVAEVERDGQECEVAGLAVSMPCYVVQVGLCLKLIALVVSSELRGHGIGTELMRVLCRRAVDSGAASIEWEIVEGSRSLNFYQKRLGASIAFGQERVDGSFSLED